VLTPDGQQIRIEADQRLNAVIVRDQADRLARYEQLIAQLDVEPQSLEIEATIIDVNTDRLRELGINWRWNNAGYGVQVGNGANAPAQRRRVVSAVLGRSASSFAHQRAAGRGAARVVSSPQVVTLSNVEAVFDNSSTSTCASPPRRGRSLQRRRRHPLRVTPHVFRDKATRIKLMVNVEDGNVTGRQVTRSRSSAPTINAGADPRGRACYRQHDARSHRLQRRQGAGPGRRRWLATCSRTAAAAVAHRAHVFITPRLAAAVGGATVPRCATPGAGRPRTGGCHRPATSTTPAALAAAAPAGSATCRQRAPRRARPRRAAAGAAGRAAPATTARPGDGATARAWA
jgi:type III secretion protein C